MILLKSNDIYHFKIISLLEIYILSYSLSFTPLHISNCDKLIYKDYII